MKIKLLVWCSGFVPEQFKSDSDFDDFVAIQVNKNALHSFEKDNPLNEMVVFDFEVPEDLDKQLIIDICNGKAYSTWFEHLIDFYRDYYQYWFFIEKDGKWER